MFGIAPRPPGASDLVPAPRRRPSRWWAGVGTILVALLVTTLPAAIPSDATASAGRPATVAADQVRGVGFQVGQPAPDFTVMTLDGQALTGADLLAQQKPFVLYFFARW